MINIKKNYCIPGKHFFVIIILYSGGEDGLDSGVFSGQFLLYSDNQKTLE